MVPSIFDEAGGKIISATWTSSIRYTYYVLYETSSCDLQGSVMETPYFEVELSLVEEDVPAIASKGAENGAVDEHIGSIGMVIGSAVAVLFYCM